MSRWAGVLLVLLAATAVPLVSPRSLRDGGWLPDAAVVGAVLVAFRATPGRAAAFGAVLGAAASVWSPEPVLFRPWLLGTLGWASSHVATAFRQDRTSVRMATVAAGVLVVRGAEHVAAAFAGADAAWVGWGFARAATAALLGAVVSAAAAPAAFAFSARWRLLAPLERTFRDV